MTYSVSTTHTTYKTPLHGLSLLLPIFAKVQLIDPKSHVCVLQTALQLRQQGIQPYVLADGVSSCNKEEISIALARIRQDGGIVSTSESIIFELVGE